MIRPVCASRRCVAGQGESAVERPSGSVRVVCHGQGGSSGMPLGPERECLTALPTRTYHSFVLCRWCVGYADVVHWMPVVVRSRVSDIRIISTVRTTTVSIKGGMSGFVQLGVKNWNKIKSINVVAPSSTFGGGVQLDTGGWR